MRTIDYVMTMLMGLGLAYLALSPVVSATASSLNKTAEILR